MYTMQVHIIMIHVHFRTFMIHLITCLYMYILGIVFLVTFSTKHLVILIKHTLHMYMTCAVCVRHLHVVLIFK